MCGLSQSSRVAKQSRGLLAKRWKSWLVPLHAGPRIKVGRCRSFSQSSPSSADGSNGLSKDVVMVQQVAMTVRGRYFASIFQGFSCSRRNGLGT